MKPVYYCVVKDVEQAQRIAAGASPASALFLCTTVNEAVANAITWKTEYPSIDIMAVYRDLTYRWVTWQCACEQVPDHSSFAGIGGA